MNATIILIVIVLGACVLFWLVRSRGNTAGGHIDTSATALGAATEAVEDVVDAVVHGAERTLAAEVEAAGARPGDIAALEAASAATMASAGAVETTVPNEPGAPDDLRQLKGVGPKLVATLHSLGITGFGQIAAWSEADIDRIDAQLGTFKGRIRRDAWVEQAGYLANGDVAGFEAKFGKL